MSEPILSELQLRQQLIDSALRLNSSGLSVGKSGNVSARFSEGLLITPTGLAYEQLQPEDIVYLNAKGQSMSDSEPAPSSEWHFHCDLYRARTDIDAIVHCHSNYATALACTARKIPAFHYMVAVAGGKEIPLASYALFGTEDLSTAVVGCLQTVNACLMQNHGQLAMATTLSQAFNLAMEVESLAEQYTLAKTLGNVQLLTDQQMDAVLEQFKDYGQRS